jgi:hypothetical protein
MRDDERRIRLTKEEKVEEKEKDENWKKETRAR